MSLLLPHRTANPLAIFEEPLRGGKRAKGTKGEKKKVKWREKTTPPPNKHPVKALHTFGRFTCIWAQVRLNTVVGSIDVPVDVTAECCCCCCWWWWWWWCRTHQCMSVMFNHLDVTYSTCQSSFIIHHCSHHQLHQHHLSVTVIIVRLSSLTQLLITLSTTVTAVWCRGNKYVLIAHKLLMQSWK